MHSEVNGYIYASDGKRVLAVLRGNQDRVLVTSDQISPLMKQAIVAIEDKRFYEHRGIDIHGIIRAIWADVTTGKAVQGGSTITQQLVKNTYVSTQRSISRKLKEAALAWQLEQQWSKDRILTAYLNTIYFGNGAYGIQQAAETYFGHGAVRLNLPESALLAGIPEDPSLNDPVTNPKDARARRRQVLQALLDQHDITRGQFAYGNNYPLPQPQDVRLPGTEGPAQYFVNYVKQLLVDRYGTARVFGGGLKVVTSIDIGLQMLARKAISQYLTADNGPAAALVAIDPRNGQVLAMVGGDNYRQSQFNLAVQGERQPGSSFKPFVLAAALAQGISPSTTFESKPVTIDLGNKLWYVHNYEGSNLGTIDLNTATAESDNTVYAQLTDLVGPDAVAAMAHKLGVTSPLQSYFAIGLGADPVNPLEMARAYSSFANGGNRVDGSIFGNHPNAIVSVNGYANAPVKRPAFSSNTAAIVDSMLGRVLTEGTGVRAALPDRVAAGKTGTTENYGDAWFVGYTPQLAVAVWIGYPKNLTPMLTEFQGKPVAGGTFPALIWKAFMEKALPYLKDPPESFPSPQLPGTETRQLVLRDGTWQLDNGNCKNLVSVVYFTGYGPGKTADCKPNEVDVPNVIGDTYAEATARLAAQPLTSTVVYKPAAPGQAIGVVVGQLPPRGRLSSYDKVTLVFAKALHGVVPAVVGLRAQAAQDKLKKLRLVPFLSGIGGIVVSQKPHAGVAAAPGMPIRLVLSRG